MSVIVAVAIIVVFIAVVLVCLRSINPDLACEYARHRPMHWSGASPPRLWPVQKRNVSAIMQRAKPVALPPAPPEPLAPPVPRALPTPSTPSPPTPSCPSCPQRTAVENWANALWSDTWGQQKARGLMGFSELSTNAVDTQNPPRCGGQWIRDVVEVPMSSSNTNVSQVVYTGSLTFPRPSYVHSLYVSKPAEFVNNTARFEMLGNQWGLGSTYDLLNLVPQRAYQGQVMSGSLGIRILLINPNRLNSRQVACANGTFCDVPPETTQMLPSTLNVEIWIYSCPAST